MATISFEDKKKLINIKGNTFYSLSVAAARKGTNLKRYIEELLDKAAEDCNDVEMYEYILKVAPEGKERVSEQEKLEFEDWLGLWELSTLRASLRP